MGWRIFGAVLVLFMVTVSWAGDLISGDGEAWRRATLQERVDACALVAARLNLGKLEAFYFYKCMNAVLSNSNAGREKVVDVAAVCAVLRERGR